MFAGLAIGDETTTVQMSSILVNAADSNDAALTDETTCWSTADLWPEISEKFSIVEIMFWVFDAGDPCGTTFSYEIYAAKRFGSAQKVAAGTATCGAAQLSHNPISGGQLDGGSVDPNSRWVDTLSEPTSDWCGGVATQNDGGADDIASVLFDRQGAVKIWCRIYSRSSGGMTVYCVANGY